MLHPPRHLQLTGGDYFIHAIDRRMRRAGMAGNVCRIVIRLEGGLEAEPLRQRVATSPMLNWLGRVRMIRLLPVLSPLWRVSTRPGEILHEHQGNGASGDVPASLPPAVLERPLPAGGSPALALDLVRHVDGTAHLVFSWNHALLDVHGAELLLRHLHKGDGAAGGLEDSNLVDPRQTSFNLLRHWRNFPRRVMTARGSLALINKTCGEPLLSLLPTPRPAKECHNHFRVCCFSEEETARIDAHGECRNTGFRRSLFYLAALIKALHTVVAARGGEPGAYLVPVPHDLRRRGARGPIFSNQLSFLFYRIEPHLAASLTDTIGELTRQMTDQVRDRTPESFQAAMEMFKVMPLDFYIHRLGRPTRGKFASFFFTDAGETCVGIHELLGARVTAVTHLAPASRPPGLTVVFSRFRRQLTAVLSWVDDCLALAEVGDLERGLRSALLGEEAR
jgi:hypothetical protein